MPVDLDLAAFERLVEEALDGIPAELAARVDNVVVLVVDDAPDDEPDLLGLYDGVSLTDDTGAGGPPELPGRILLFRRPLLAMCETEEELRHEVRVTVVHEVAHHFGIDDDRLHALGWG